MGVARDGSCAPGVERCVVMRKEEMKESVNVVTDEGEW